LFFTFWQTQCFQFSTANQYGEILTGSPSTGAFLNTSGGYETPTVFPTSGYISEKIQDVYLVTVTITYSL